MSTRPLSSDFFAPAATVLVVDDAASARRLVTKTLEQIGFLTLVAADGQTALSAVHTFHPDAIVTDLEMPGMGGEKLIAALRASDDLEVRKVPIIVCSSKMDETTLSELERLQADAIIPKPVDVRRLAEAAIRLIRIG